MADPIKIDMHVHLYPTPEAGLAEKRGYEIWEYGERRDVQFSDYAGTVSDISEAMDSAGISQAVLLALFMGRLLRDAAMAELPQGLSGSERQKAVARVNENLARRLEEVNRWCCEVRRKESRIVPFVTADVTVLSAPAAAAHVRDMVENHGARGVKLHGAMQGFSMSDDRLWPLYETCQELGVPVLGHSGPDRQGAGFAEPRAFGDMLKAFPDLPVVLAHMGGATWSQAREIAATYPNAYFDCCEIIEWTGAPNAPSDHDLARLIKDIGPHRVMMGSDFPWYDLDHTVDRVMELPLLSNEEKAGILGANAQRILKL